MNGAGIRKGLFDWFMLVVFCVSLRSEKVEDSQVSETLHAPERSLLQSGRKVMSLSVRLDAQSSVYWGISGGMTGKTGKKSVIRFSAQKSIGSGSGW